MNRAETAAVVALADAFGDLIILPSEVTGADQDGSAIPSVDVQSEAGHMFCMTFLARMESCAEAFRLDAAPRNFRSEFSVNYRALFPDGARHYRVDVLEASIDRHQVVWVNGDKFELSSETIGFAEELQHALFDLGALLRRREGSEELVSSRDELAAALTRLDIAWAAFEHRYIANLIIIEDRARQLVVRAVDAERRLRRMEAAKPRAYCRGNAPLEYLEAQRKLVECISSLNAVANHRRKGRDDLRGDILESAFAALTNCDGEDDRHAAAKVLAADIVGAFDAIREYLREVKSCLERVDPHLCNNPGLVARLVDWEESWEVGGRYVRHAPLSDALCDLVSKIQGIQCITPALATMCEECDVELFLVLPRITLLAFLAHPQGQQAELLKVLLPHRFSASAGPDGQPSVLQELSELVQQFHHASAEVARAVAPQFAHGAGGVPVEAQAYAWETLVRRAVDGKEDGESSVWHRADAQVKSEANAAVDAFSRELEKWSVELQRHCPEDWNQCSAVLVQCLTGSSKRHRFVKFQV